MTRAPRLLRALLGALLGALLSLAPFGFAGAARAASNPCVSNVTTFIDVAVTNWTSPAGATDDAAHQCTPDTGATLTGTYNVHFDAGSLDSLSSFSVAIVPAKGLPTPVSATVTHSFKLLASTLQDSITFPWDTSAQTPYNGVYSISATAVSLLGDVASAQVTQLSVNNPPAPPAHVNATVVNGQPTVTWAKNAEPDITGYQVLRASGGTYSQVGSVTSADSPSYTDTSAAPGSPFTYEVVAVRRSPLTNNGIKSSPSQATGQVTPGVVAVQPVALPSIPAPAKVSAPTLKPITVGGNQPAPIDNTFAPSLPFGQAIPSATDTAPAFTTGTVTLAGDTPGKGGTSTAQKLRFIAAAALLIVVAGFILRFARKLMKGL